MIRKVRLRSGLLIAAMALVFSGCTSIRSYRSADPYVITHHTWWNHYQRGRLLLQEGNYAAARKDFEIALGRVPGARYPYAQERWRARTYGMHMIEGYFPHRELGICLFEMDEPAEALTLLETSMKLEPSARAKFYINRTHAKLAEAAAPPPVIAIDPLPDWTGQRNYILQGTALGSNRIARLRINGEPEFIELATHLVRFRKSIPLTEGHNSIHIDAEDISGKQTSTNLVLRADWTPPQIYLSRNGTDLVITCRDNLGLHQLQTGNRTLSTDGTEYTFTQPILPDQPIRLTATDWAGNKTDWALSEKELLHLARRTEAGPPRVQIDNAGKNLVLFNPEYSMDIRVDDDVALKSVELNGESLLSRTTPLFRTLRRIPLVPGTNNLVVIAEDFDGNRTEKRVSVIYRNPEYLDRIYRLAAMCSPLSGEISDPAMALRIDHLIENTLTRDPVRFYLLAPDNETRQLQSEQTLSNSALADPRALLKAGKLLDADLLFATRILSDAPGQTVYTQVLDAHSGEELFIEDVYVENPDRWPEQLDGLVMKIEQRFPLIQGRVHTSGSRLVINAGERNGAQKGMRMLVIRSQGSFEQGRVVMDSKRPVELVISRVASQTSEVIMPHGQPRDSVHAGDYVFSR